MACVKIFQIKNIECMESCGYAYRWWSDKVMKKFNINDYEIKYQFEDFSNDDDFNILEDCFCKFNRGSGYDVPDDFTGHSLSVSDVISIDNKYYYCDSIGWKNITEFVINN